MKNRRAIKNVVLVAAVILLIGLGGDIKSEPYQLPDADWPVERRPTDAELKIKIERLSKLVGKIEARRLDASYARSTLMIARESMGYAAEDEKNGRPGRASYVRGYLDEALDKAAGDATSLLRNPSLNRPVPRPPLRDIVIRDGAFFSGETQVMFGGVGHFGKVREDIPKFYDYGFNLIQIEIGPSSVVTGPNPEDIRTDAIRDDILKQFDNADKHGVMINLLLSPHYFPQWAMEMYPELKECGRGFIQYCVSDPDARRVLRRFLQTLIPLVKDKPALQSYTLANEPNFFERSERSLNGFRTWLRKKYGDLSALNRAWNKKYKSFDQVKITVDLFSLNPGMRLDWTLYHDKICTEFFFWMKSVIRTMDKKTPVHIKFMDDMFASEETLWGVDREALGKFTEISGNDSTIRYPGKNGYALSYWQNAAFYDFLKSIQPRKPIQNSENHFIADDAPWFYPENYVKAALWLEYLHGMAASTIWVWERGDGPTLGNNILSRPNCTAAAAKTTLDVRRLAPYITAVANSIKDSPVSIYYSKTARILQLDFLEKWNSAYELALYTGYPAHFVVDSDVAAGLDPKKTPVLIVPEYIYTTDELYRKIIEYIGRGGRVAAIGECFRMNERGRNRVVDQWAAARCGSGPKNYKGCAEILPTSAKTTPEANFQLLNGFLFSSVKIPHPDLVVGDLKGKPVIGVEYRSVRFKKKHVGYVFNSLDHPVTVRLAPVSGRWRDTVDMIENRPVKKEMKLEPMDIILFEF